MIDLFIDATTILLNGAAMWNLTITLIRRIRNARSTQTEAPR